MLPFPLYPPVDARPTESEQAVFIMAESVLFDAADILQHLQTYKGASAEIRQVSISQLKHHGAATLLRPPTGTISHFV